MFNRELIREHVSLAPMTTLGIGGPARFFADSRSEDDLFEALAFARQFSIPTFIFGGGSNLLVADEGYPGLMVRIAFRGIDWHGEQDQVLVTARAGEDWDDFVRQCVERDLAGVECLSGIPGFVGGTPVQNVGAYGQEVSETIVSVRALDRRTERVVELSNADCGFTYRTSIFNSTERDRYIVLAVTYSFELQGEPAIRYPDVQNFFADSNQKPGLRKVREAVRTIRARKGMVISPVDPDCRSAGSFFKNPVITRGEFARIEMSAKAQGMIREDEHAPSFPAGDDKLKIPAAWLIERTGIQKGYSRGQAGISSKHTLAIINRGGATARDVLDLADEIQGRVLNRFGIALLPEPVFVGFEKPE